MPKANFSPNEPIPETIYIWRHGDDEPSNGTWLECDDSANAGVRYTRKADCHEELVGRCAVSVESLKMLKADPKVQDAVRNPLDPFSIAWHKREDEHVAALARATNHQESGEKK